MSPTLTDLTIRAALDGKQEQFDRVLAERAAEQHWSGRAGLGGNVSPESRLTIGEVLEERGGEMCERLMSERGWSEADFRYAAGRLEASGDPDLRTLAAHMRAFEMYAAEQAGKELSRDMNAMESFLREHGVPMVRPGSVVEDQGRKWPANNAGKVHEPLGLPRTAAPLSYPDLVKPEPIDEDRRARGAMEPALSDRLRGLAQEVERLAAAASDGRQRGRLRSYGARLRAMASRQFSRELENDIAMVGDDADAELNGLANDAARDAGNRSGDGDGDHAEFASFDDWDKKPGADQQLADDIADQRDDALDLGEDLPKIPAPGRRYAGEDQFGDRADVADEPAGARKNRYDDDVLIHNCRGLRRGTGHPQGGDRYARPGQRAGTRYSAFDGKESLRESSDDLTAWLLDELEIAAKSSHSFF